MLVIANSLPKEIRKIINIDKNNGRIISYHVKDNQIVEFPRYGAFEICYKGQLLHSKLKQFIFPDLKELIYKINNGQQIKSRPRSPFKITINNTHVSISV